MIVRSVTESGKTAGADAPAFEHGTVSTGATAAAAAPAREPVTLLYDNDILESPFAQSGETGVRASDDYYGAFSIEDFPDVGDLSYTHEDAGGWLDYVDGFNQPNFWYKDRNVQPWAYYEDYDNWQDTYGMDSVNAVYHSGHGGMDANGVFFAPLGGAWGNLGSWVRSDQMRLGNEQVNYIFWSTCLSCRVLDGNTPIRTWRPANLGFRMLFGFETVSWDNPNYGKFFWEEWNKNKSFSQAWLDASWRIATDQAPAVVACGANQAEASARLYNERVFYWPHVSTGWWSWRWYNAARSTRQIFPARQSNLRVPRELTSARFAPAAFSGQRIREVVDGLGVPLLVPNQVSTSRRGSATIRDGDVQVSVAANGTFRVQLREPNRENRTPVAGKHAVGTAEEFARQVRLADDAEIVFDQVRTSNEAGGTDRGTGSIDGPYTTETTVQYRQVINGIPVISPGDGEFRVTVDNDGQVTSVESSLRSVDRVMRSGMSHPPEPNASPRNGGPPSGEEYEDKLAGAWSKELAKFAARGRIPAMFAEVPGSTEIGYAIEGDRAILVAQRAIEVDFGHGLKKRYWVRAPLG